MKRRLLTYFVFLISLNFMKAQEAKNFDFIIMVDDEIWTTPTTPKISVKDSQGNIINTFYTDYHAGNLSIKESDYQSLLSDNVNSIDMSLKYSKVCDDETYYYDYEIDFKQGWLKNYFFVLKIYNTERKKYRKIYEPLEGKKYTFEYDSSNGQMLRVTKKKRKKECCD
ncbi:hypothetical protein [Winogradskyella sp.]|uniref:hypothetical protein n=1 Tax=Winogradskyella sp. TaxID=1883156 RepID=UPI002639A7BA|nr:hypothetical protein [Winogradskyella sp.]